MESSNTFFFHTRPDPRVKDWFLLNEYSPVYISTLLITYFTFAFVILPYLRECHVEVKNLKGFMNVHNTLLVIMNSCLALLFLRYMVKAEYSMFCEGVKHHSVGDKNEMSLARLCWLYFLSKLFELNDIVFNIFRARPSSSQVNSQVYHHSTMVAVSWAGARYLPGGSSAIMSCINCSLHVIMYVYFAFSGKTLDCGGLLDARAVMTICTIVQFVLVVCHCFTGIYFQCNYPTSAYALVIILVITYILGFSFRSYFSNYTIGIQIEEEDDFSESYCKAEISDEEDQDINNVDQSPAVVGTGNIASVENNASIPKKSDAE